MTTITIDRAVVEQALEALRSSLYPQPRQLAAIAALHAALALAQDAELSAALGWPGGISEPVLDRGELLRMVAALALAQEQAKPVEPVAWRTFDGEGGYDYRSYEDNENYAAEWAQRNPLYVGWVEPLYTSPPPRKQAELERLRAQVARACVRDVE